MKWTDTILIAEALFDTHPDIDPLTVRFTDLHRWVTELDGLPVSGGEPGPVWKAVLAAYQDYKCRLREGSIAE
jgi:FeS assembly protein IscX